MAKTQRLTAVANPTQLAKYLDEHSTEQPHKPLNQPSDDTTLWFDLELDPKSKDKPKLIEGAFVVGSYYWQFDVA